MADIIEYPVWEETVREVGEGEPVTGGPNGTVNYSLQDLANRTLWLKERVNLVITGRTVNGSILDFKNTTEIETEKWGKARDFIIADASQKHTSVTVSVNGSNAVTLVLPNTISANIIGNVTGDVTGNLTGNVTGNVRGNLDGDASGNAGSADKLSGQPAINGTAFNGTRDIDTERWGKARKITVQDADGTNKATAVSTDGGKDFTLKLPATIKATIKGNADSATKLGTADVGSSAKPIYLKAGAPTPSSSSVGGTAKPIYMAAGELKAISATVGNAAKPVFLSGGEIKPLTATLGGTAKPVYLSGGELKELSATLGGTARPVYLDKGELKPLTGNVGSTVIPVYLQGGSVIAMKDSVGDTATPVYMKAGAITKLSANVGSATKPVFMQAGKIVECSHSLNKTVPADANFENTHYTTHLYVGASKANAHSAQTNGNVYLNLFDDTTLRHNINVVGSGSVTVTSATNGKITIDHLTSDGHKHIPAGGSSGQILKWSTDGTAVWDALASLTNHSSTAHSINICGVLFQWGRATVQNDGSRSISFPKAFTAVHDVIISMMRVSGSGAGGSYTHNSIDSISNTGFTAKVNIEGVGGSNIYVNWIAVGV